MQWPAYNLRAELPSPWLEIILVLAAFLCGAIIGTERERHDKPAGLRTLILICLGSAIFTMVSFAFTSTTGDSGRVAAQIVTGVGFLGAGAILHSGATVSGMTTAAAIWLTAAIGITVGIGRPAPALALALLTRLVLAGVRHWEIRHLGGLKNILLEITFHPDHGKTQIRLDCLRDTFHLRTPFTVEPLPDSLHLQARLNLQLPRRHLHELLNAIIQIPAVHEIRQLPIP